MLSLLNIKDPTLVQSAALRINKIGGGRGVVWSELEEKEENVEECSLNFETYI